ncbi:MAG: hypothetical protein IKY70_01980 [Bacteroidales bacterium]|nr:hypothetical protein [Bacteroidales bacterium]
MRAIIKNIFLIAVISAYVTSTAGFTLSHCFCSNTFKVTSSILNAYTNSSSEAYTNHVSDVAGKDGEQSFNKSNCCGDSIFSIDGIKYNNEDNLIVSFCDFVHISHLPVVPQSISISDTKISGSIVFDTHLPQLKKLCSQDILCTFLC